MESKTKKTWKRGDWFWRNNGDEESQPPIVRTSNTQLSGPTVVRKTSVTWQWALMFVLAQSFLGVLCGCFAQKRRLRFEDSFSGPLDTVSATIPASRSSVLLRMMVMHNAMAEVIT